MDWAAGDGRTRRVRGLDGVRGVAIAAVLAYHAFPGAAPGGFFGVEVFFVLSGYLLTTVLLGERGRRGTMSLERYLRRRIGRVVPALVAVLLGVVLLAHFVVPEDAHRVPRDVLAALGGLTNWQLISEGTSYFRELGRPSLVRHLWSLSIEMQFYVLCPFLVALLARLRRRTALAWLALAVTASAVAMAALAGGGDPSRAYFGTDTRIGALLTGVLLAFCLSSRGNSGRNSTAISSRRALVAGAGGALVLGGLVFLAAEQSRALYPAGFLACRAATAALIVAATAPGRAGGVLGAPVLRWLGQRSYGIYLWHWPLLAVTRPGIDVDWSPWVARGGAVALACVLGELSYRLVEAPFARPRLATVSTTVAARRNAMRWSLVGAALTGTGLVATMLPSVDPIAASLAAGAQVVSSQSAVAAATTTTTASAIEPAVPGDAVAALALPPHPLSSRRPPPMPRMFRPRPPPPPTMQAPPAAAFPTTAIGDSVMLGAAPALQARFGPNVFIDAKVSRQFAEGVVEARRLRDAGRLGRVVFVHLGTNGPPRPAEVDALMNVLAGVEQVRFVNVRVNRPWEAATNQTLADAAARYAPKVQLVDWNAFSAGHLDWFQSDGTHAKGAGADAFANLLASYLPAEG